MGQDRESRARRVGKGTGLVLAGAVGATALTGIAFADQRGDDASATATAPVVADDNTGDATQRGARGGMFGGPGTGPVLHGRDTIRIGDDNYLEILIQNGTITELSADSITVRSDDKYTETYAIGTDTKIRLDRAESQASELAVGRPVRVIANTDKTARHIGSTTVEGQAAISEHRQQLREKFRDLMPQRPTDSATPSASTA